jgi:hypothetical protein
MSLQDLLNEGYLKAHKTSKNEINQLLVVYERDLVDAQVEDVSDDRRFAIAYNAALMVAVAALAVSGRQATGEAAQTQWICPCKSPVYRAARLSRYDFHGSEF